VAEPPIVLVQVVAVSVYVAVVVEFIAAYVLELDVVITADDEVEDDDEDDEVGLAVSDTRPPVTEY